MATTALSVLETRLGQSVGDDLEVAVTTAIAANNSIISTNLQTYDGGRDSFRVDGFVYITDKANAGVQRQISAYTSSTGTLTVRGVVLLTDTANLATIRIHRYDRNKYVQAFNNASRELFGKGIFWKDLDVFELVTGNILPNSHFRDWAVTTYPDKYTVTNSTAVASTAAGTYRGGGKSAKVTASAGNGYMSVHSDNYPRLLDLAGHTVNLYAWALPEVANDPVIVIYTKQADGTAQTLSSTTAAPAGEFTLLKLENQLLNTNLVECEIRFKVTTNAKYVYFDNARLVGGWVQEYLLPTDFQVGRLSNVEIQRSFSSAIGSQLFPCDDLLPTYWTPVHDYEIVADGTDQYLRLGEYWNSSQLIRITGKAPLSTLTNFTDTIEIGGEAVNLFIAYAKYLLFQSIESPVASQDIGRYQTQAQQAYAEFQRLSPLKMKGKPVRMRIRS